MDGSCAGSRGRVSRFLTANPTRVSRIESAKEYAVKNRVTRTRKNARLKTARPECERMRGYNPRDPNARPERATLSPRRFSSV